MKKVFLMWSLLLVTTLASAQPARPKTAPQDTSLWQIRIVTVKSPLVRAEEIPCYYRVLPLPNGKYAVASYPEQRGAELEELLWDIRNWFPDAYIEPFWTW